MPAWVRRDKLGPSFSGRVLAIWLRRQGSWPEWLSPPSMDNPESGENTCCVGKIPDKTDKRPRCIPPLCSTLAWPSPVLFSTASVHATEKMSASSGLLRAGGASLGVAILPLWRGRGESLGCCLPQNTKPWTPAGFILLHCVLSRRIVSDCWVSKAPESSCVCALCTYCAPCPAPETQRLWTEVPGT